jgi:hypothetical protein
MRNQKEIRRNLVQKEKERESQDVRVKQGLISSIICTTTFLKKDQPKKRRIKK